MIPDRGREIAVRIGYPDSADNEQFWSSLEDAYSLFNIDQLLSFQASLSEFENREGHDSLDKVEPEWLIRVAEAAFSCSFSELKELAGHPSVSFLPMDESFGKTGGGRKMKGDGWLNEPGRQKRIVELHEKLQRLKESDTELCIFGAKGQQWGHGYAFHPVSEEELLLWETDCSLKLPEEYRDYLKLVGYGTGPGYGLLSPVESRKLYQQIYNSISYYVEFADTGGWYEERDFNKKTGYGRITYFHELKNKHLKRYKRLLEAPLPENMEARGCEWYFMDIVPRVLSVEGVVILTNHGHKYWDVLVVDGEMAGTVWQVDGCAGQSMRAQPDGFYERGKPVPGTKKASGFLTYMERWADKALEECESKYLKKSEEEQ